MAKEASVAAKKLVVELAATRGVVFVKRVEFDSPGTSLMFGRHLKVMVQVDKDTKKVRPSLYYDHSNTYLGVVEARIANGDTYIPTRMTVTPEGNPIEFVLNEADIVAAALGKEIKVAAVPVKAAEPKPEPKKEEKKSAKKPPKEEEPEEEDETEGDDDETEAEGDDSEGEDEGDDDAEGDDDDDETEGDDDESEDDEEGIDLPTATREELIEAAKQLGIEWDKKWSDEKLRKACIAAYEAAGDDDETEGDDDEAEGDDDGEEAEGDEDEGEEDEGEEEPEEEAPKKPSKKPKSGKKKKK